MKTDALKDAVKYLAVRARSEAEVRAYLAKHGHGEEAAEECLGELRQRKLVGDETLAKGWAAELAAKGKSGRTLALKKLMERGIPKELAETSIEATWQEVDESSVAVGLLKKKFRISGGTGVNEMARAARFLKSRGYGTEAISKALKEAFDGE